MKRGDLARAMVSCSVSPEEKTLHEHEREDLDRAASPCAHPLRSHRNYTALLLSSQGMRVA